MSDTVAISSAENREDLIDTDKETVLKISDGYKVPDENSFAQNDIIELLEHNKAIVSNIEKSHDLITKAQSSFGNLLNNLSYFKSKNLELEKQIEKISIEKAKEVQAIKNTMSEVEKDKNKQIEKLNQEIKILQEKKNNKIRELENEILSVKQSSDDEIKLLNNEFEKFKLEKEDEINNLHKEIERLQTEGEKDKKVLDEFQNIISILEKIKGIFKKAENKTGNSDMDNY